MGRKDSGSGPAPEVGQARVREQQKLEELVREVNGDSPSPQETDFVQEEIPTPTPGISDQIDDSDFTQPSDPLIRALETLPDSDLQKLAFKFRLRLGAEYNRAKAVRVLASMGLGPDDLSE